MKTFPRRVALATALLVALAVAAGAGEPRKLRVGTTGDYAPYSVADGKSGYTGFDLAVARAYAEERGLELEIVPFRWPRLVEALRSGRFDVAMGGITVRPERSAAGRYSVPVVESGAVLLVRRPERWPNLDAFDTRAARLGVNAGGHLEQVARQRFPDATLITIPENDAVIVALRAASIDAAVTEEIEAALWRKQVEGSEVRGPFSRDRKAYLVRAERADLAADLDAWLLEKEADGSLAELRSEHLEGASSGPVATPLGALLAALDERLALMPLVGAAKRKQGIPLEVPEREGFVIDAAVAAVGRAAREASATPPPEAAVRAFFRAQIEAAKQVQWAAVQDDFEAPELPDVKTVLRPALQRIDEKIARLLVALPEGLDEKTVRRAALDQLWAPYLETDRAVGLADAIVQLSNAPRPSSA